MPQVKAVTAESEEALIARAMRRDPDALAALMRHNRRLSKRLVLEDFENVVPLRAPGSEDAPAENPEGAAMRGQLRLYLEAAVGELPEEQRTVFVLRALEELSVEETAAVLDLNPQTVRTRFMRARRRLQSRLHDELKLTFGEMLTFDGARCDRLVTRVLERLAAIPSA